MIGICAAPASRPPKIRESVAIRMRKYFMTIFMTNNPYALFNIIDFAKMAAIFSTCKVKTAGVLTYDYYNFAC
jgi:hypothetical protein